MQEQYEFLFKFLIIGNAGVGKSCLLHHFIENKMKQNSVHTIGVEFASKVIQVNNRTVKLQIWDTAGQERFRSVARSYYRGASGALVVYDITNRDSYSAATSWLEDARNLAGGELSAILVGNKRDLAEERGGAAREVSVSEAESLSKDLGMLEFMETSAVTGERVVDAFEACARAVVARLDSDSSSEAISSSNKTMPGGYGRVSGGDVRQRWNRRSESPGGGIRLSKPRDGTKACPC